MRTKSRILCSAAVLCAALLGLSLASARTESSRSEREQVERSLEGFMSALSRGDVSGAVEYLDPDFAGHTPTGEYIQGREAYRAYLLRVRQLAGIGAGGSFEHRITGKDLVVDKHSAKGTISTYSELRTAHGDVIPWEKSYPIEAVRIDGRWALRKADAKMNLGDKVTLAVRMLARRIWKGGLTLRAPKAAAPDFDSDYGQQQAGARALSEASLETRPH